MAIAVKYQVRGRREQVVQYLRKRIEGRYSLWHSCLWGWLGDTQFELSLQGPLLLDGWTTKLVGKFIQVGDFVYIRARLRVFRLWPFYLVFAIFAFIVGLINGIQEGDYSVLLVAAVMLVIGGFDLWYTSYAMRKCKHLFITLLDEYRNNQET